MVYVAYTVLGCCRYGFQSTEAFFRYTGYSKRNCTLGFFNKVINERNVTWVIFESASPKENTTRISELYFLLVKQRANITHCELFSWANFFKYLYCFYWKTRCVTWSHTVRQAHLKSSLWPYIAQVGGLLYVATVWLRNTTPNQPIIGRYTYTIHIPIARLPFSGKITIAFCRCTRIAFHLGGMKR